MFPLKPSIVTNKRGKMIPIFKPNYSNEELKALEPVLKSGWVGLGPKTKEFENAFAKYINSKFAVGTNSATAALHLALNWFDIKGKEVLLPSFTFISTAHAILYNGGITVFVDIEPDTLCMDPTDVAKKITKKTKVILPVHYAGHPCNMNALLKLAKQYKLALIDDAAHACGSSYRDTKIGSIGDATCFSFQAVKNLAVGEGGMVTTNKKRMDSFLRKQRWLGIDKDTWNRSKQKSYSWYYEVHDIGYKSNMHDISAAIGLVQLKKLDAGNRKRKEIAKEYTKGFEDIPWLQTPIEKDDVNSSWHIYCVRTKYRDKLNLFLKERGISTGVHYMPAHLHPVYKDYRTKLRVTENEWKKVLSLPIFPALKKRDVSKIISDIRRFKP